MIFFLAAACAPPEPGDYEVTPSETFLTDLTDPGEDTVVTRTAPYFGTESACPHNGAHVHFQNVGSDAFSFAEIISPFEGTVAEIETCKDITESDGFQIELGFAEDGMSDAVLQMSIEPQDGFH